MLNKRSIFVVSSLPCINMSLDQATVSADFSANSKPCPRRPRALTLFPLRREDAAAARKAGEKAGADAMRLEGGLREVRGKLEQRRSDTTAQRSQGAVIQALMQAKAKGEIPGIYGRLGEASLHWQAEWPDAKPEMAFRCKTHTMPRRERLGGHPSPGCPARLLFCPRPGHHCLSEHR